MYRCLPLVVADADSMVILLTLDKNLRNKAMVMKLVTHRTQVRVPVELIDVAGSQIYTTKIDVIVCPPNISETVAGRLMKLAHRPRIASTMIKLISKPILLPILLILVKLIQRIVADPKRKLSPPFDSADSVPSLGHPAPGSGKMLSLFTVLCDYLVWLTEPGAQPEPRVKRFSQS